MTDIVKQATELLASAEKCIKGSSGPDHALAAMANYGDLALSSIRPLVHEIERLREQTQWRDIASAPKDGAAILVWLPEKHLGSHVQTMRTGKVATIGGVFHWDAGKPEFWLPLPSPPVQEESE